MVDIQSLSFTLAALSVVAGVAYNSYSLRVQNKSRQAQIYISLWQRLNSLEMMHSMEYIRKVKASTYEEWRKLNETDQKYSDSWDYFFTTFEAIGAFVNEDLLGIQIVLRDCGGIIPRYWKRYEAVIREHRKQMNNPRYYIEFEYLYEKTVEFARKHPEFMIPLN